MITFFILTDDRHLRSQGNIDGQCNIITGGESDAFVQVCVSLMSMQSKLVVLKSLGTFLSRAMSTQDPGRYQPNAEDISAQMRQTPTWFMAAAFSSPSAFAAFDGSIKPNLPSSNSSAVRRWREENDPDGDEEFVGSFPLVCGDPDESWSFESLSHLEFGSLAEDVGSSSGIKPESAYISVRTSWAILYHAHLASSIWRALCTQRWYLPSSIVPRLYFLQVRLHQRPSSRWSLPSQGWPIACMLLSR